MDVPAHPTFIRAGSLSTRQRLEVRERLNSTPMTILQQLSPGAQGQGAQLGRASSRLLHAQRSAALCTLRRDALLRGTPTSIGRNDCLLSALRMNADKGSAGSSAVDWRARLAEVGEMPGDEFMPQQSGGALIAYAPLSAQRRGLRTLSGFLGGPPSHLHGQQCAAGHYFLLGLVA